MKLNDFRKKMVKSPFLVEEALRVALGDNPATLRLQLHQWTGKGDLIRLKRGLYVFPERVSDKVEVAKVLYGPAYVSLESALNAHGLIPDAVFSLTLVTPRGTRVFRTPLGDFAFHKIRKDLFWGYDSETLMGLKEKVVVDYCYLNSGRLTPSDEFWQAARWQNLDTLDFVEAMKMASRYGSKKVIRLVASLREFAKRYGSP